MLAKNPFADPPAQRRRELLSPALRYRFERVFVATVMRAIGELLQAASIVDPVVRREVAGFPEGLEIAISVFGDDTSVRLRHERNRLIRRSPAGTASADLEIVFKHISHAFLVFSFQEGTAQATANDRLFTRGEIALAMRLVRCLCRVEAVTLPSFVARRALRTLWPLPRAEKVALAARIYARSVRDLWRSPTP
jgi:hypothetical protein